MSQAGSFGTGGGSLPSTVPLQFTTDSGIAIPASNNLNIFGGSGITIEESGSTITVVATGTPLVSSMLAFLSTTASNVTGDGTNYTVVFNTVTYDVDGNYDNTTGLFDIPVEGTYMVTGNIALSGLGTSTVFTSFIQSNTAQLFCSSTNQTNVGNTGLLWLPFSGLMRLSPGSTIEAVVSAQGGLKNVSVFGGGGFFTWISISLVGAG